MKKTKTRKTKFAEKKPLNKILGKTNLKKKKTKEKNTLQKKHFEFETTLWNANTPFEKNNKKKPL